MLDCNGIRDALMISAKCCKFCHRDNSLFLKICGKYALNHCCNILSYFDTLNQDTLKKDIEDMLDMALYE